jgi:thiamine-monophosphate kinase
MALRLDQLGEKAFIARLLPGLPTSPAFINGFGHDASVLDLGLDRNIALKIDRAPKPVALRHQLGGYEVWGRLAVVANLSDLLAVGAVPSAFMVSLVLPASFEVDDAEAIVRGCAESCSAHQVAFVGGDTKEGAEPQVIGTALGTVSRGSDYRRVAADPGDYLFVAGRLGGFVAAVAMLAVESETARLDPEVRRALTLPRAKALECAHLAGVSGVRGAQDLSDGLADAIATFCARGAGLSLRAGTLPLDPLVRRASASTKVPPWRFAFGVGDWSVAFVVSAEAAGFLRSNKSCGLYELGQFDSSGVISLKDDEGKSVRVPTVRNEHFVSRAEDETDYLDALLGIKLRHRSRQGSA